VIEGRGKAVDYTEVLARLQEASPQELRTALAAVVAASGQYTGTPTPESLQAVADLATAARQLRGEIDARAQLATDQAAQLAELSTLGEIPAEPAADPAPVEPEPTTDPNAATDDPNGTGAPTEPEGGTAVTAASRRLGGQLNVDPSAARAAFPRVRVRPVALDAVFADAGPVLNRATIAEGFSTKANQAFTRGGGTGRIDLLRYVTEFPEERHLSSRDSWAANRDKVEAVQESASGVHATQNALVAAGLCAPFEVLYDIPVLGEDDRPVRAALSRFGADRGGITYRPALDGVTQTGGIGTWTEANDEASPLVPKTCFEVVCPGVLTAQVEATYLCLQFSNMSTRFDPESMDSAVRAQQIAHARFAENKLLTALAAGSKALTSAQLLGATRDILVTCDKVTAYYRSVHRLSDSSSLRAILPLWARNLMRADVCRQMVGDGLASLAVVDSVIDDWFRVRNINITWHLDGVNPPDLTVPTPDVVTAAQFYTLAVAESPVPGFPDTVQMLLWAEGDWLLLDGGELNLGLVRDSVLNSENRFQTFSESWEIPVNRGVEPLVIYMAVQPTGASAATVSTVGTVD
jgi:hypothetical protein